MTQNDSEWLEATQEHAVKHRIQGSLLTIDTLLGNPLPSHHVS